MTLPANSTFLPVLDDLLSPDFRPLHLPAQTPQTPTDVVSFAGAKIITNAYGNITGLQSGLGTARQQYQVVPDQRPAPGPAASEPQNRVKFGRESSTESETAAASKIQNWWKSRRSVSIDLGAERAKHAIRHNRTEDHIRYLEAEVSRLKAALSSERKIRSLQLEAIRSLWGQLQRISSVDSGGGSASSLMTRSVPNGLPKDTDNPENSVMSMSLNTALDVLPSVGGGGVVANSGQSHPDSGRCSCTKEVESLREVFTQEISQLRSMINQFTSTSMSNSSGTNNSCNKSSDKPDGEKTQDQQNELAHKNGSQQKRPDSLNLPGVSNAEQPEGSRNSPANPEKSGSLNEEKMVADYASQMASKLVDDAVEDKDNNNKE